MTDLSLLLLAVLIGVVMIKEALFRFVLSEGRSVDSAAVKSDAWHHRSDAITSATAFVGISVALLGGEGAELVLDLYWSRDRELPPGTYVVAIRFDRKELPLPFDGKPFPKITRKIVERWKGERFRFRADHMIQGGLFAPDAWRLPFERAWRKP